MKNSILDITNSTAELTKKPIKVKSKDGSKFTKSQPTKVQRHTKASKKRRTNPMVKLVINKKRLSNNLGKPCEALTY